MLIKRVVSALIAAIILITILLFPYKIMVNIAVAVASIIALYEIYSSFHFIKNRALCFLGYLSAILFAFYEYTSERTIVVFILLFIVSISVTFLVLRHHTTIHEVSVMFFLTVYFCYLLSRVITVRNMPNGEVYVWLIFFGAFMTDTGAYFSGTYFGKNKLCPDISPKKTIEGAIGGTLFTGIVFLVLGLCYEAITGVQVHMISLVILGLLCAVFAQLGDLFASVIKREGGIKDFGSIMPGHGGIFDRLDSVLFVAPLIHAFLTFFEIII